MPNYLSYFTNDLQQQINLADQLTDLQNKVGITPAGQPSIVEQLAERVKQVNGISPDTNGNVSINVSGQPLKYGELKMPSDFTPVLPCKIYRDNDGLIKHNMDFTNRYKNGTAIYVSPTGNDTTGNGSQGTPYRTLTKAVAVALAGTDAKYTIFSSVTVFNRDEVTFDQTVTNKTIAIVSTTTDRALISANAAYTWTLDGTGTYKTARSSVYNVSDYGAKDLHGLPVALTNATTLAACQSTKNTWYTDGTNLWVHRNDEAIPTQSSTIVNLGVAGVRPVLGSGGVVYFENFIFTPIESSNSLYVSATGTTAQGELCVNNCGFVGQIRNNDTANGLATQRIKNVYVFNCVSAYAQGDGFNYHFENLNAGEPQNCFVLEYNCTGYELGTVLPGSGSNNASSIHDGSNILRIGTVGYRNTGTTIIDVNGCYSILYDCKVRTPMDYQTLVEGQGAGFSFSKDTGVRNATLYLINCGASECIDALQIGTGTTAYINNFKYTGNISNNGTINYI